MTGRFGIKTTSFTLLAVLAGALLSAPVVAQQAPGAGAPGGRQGGRQGGGRQGGFGGQLTGLQVPIAVLASNLKLTDVQQAKITAIQKDLMAARPQFGPGGPGAGAGAPAPGAPGGAAPDPEERRQAFEKFQAAQKDAETRFEGVLTDSQKAQLPALLKTLQGVRAVGIPLEVYPDLKLTAGQQSRIAKIGETFQADMQTKMEAARAANDFQSMRQAMQQGRADANKQAMDVLTDAQKQIVTKYVADHPQRGFGGGGRRGGGGAAGGN